MSIFEKQFSLKQNQTDLKTELIAGLTTFLAMAYITAVNPSILAESGMDFGAVFVATCIAAALGTLAMGLFANLPIAVAPGMGQNAFFSYGIVLTLGYTWEQALGAVFLSSVIFIILSILPVREWLVNAIPHNLKLGFSAGIGLFLGFIALRNGGVIVDDQATLVSLSNLTQFAPLACLLGFVLIVILSYKKVTGAVLIGVIAVSIAGWVFAGAQIKGVMAMPPSIAPTLFELDIFGALEVSMISIILTLLIVDVFDTAGTLVAVTSRANLLDKEGKIPRLDKALLADSSATMTGSLLGTSSTTSYIESATGVEAGGRTGLTAVVCAVLFLLCLFFAPLAQSIPSYAAAAALLFVACIMSRSLAELTWDRLDEAMPAVLAAMTMPLTFSITAGIGVGFISYVLIKVGSGNFRNCPAAVYLGAAIFVLKFAFL